MAESKKQNKTRRQHWLPRSSYLDNFTVNGRVKSYRFTEARKIDFLNTAEIKDIAPVNIGVKNDLYETPILPDNTIEKLLAQIEGGYGKVLDEKIKQDKDLSEEDHQKIAYYISALESRTLLQQQHLNSFIDRLDETGQALSHAHNAPQAAQDWAEKMALAKGEFFAQGIAVALEVNKWGPLDFCILKPASFVSVEFITSDHPVSIVDYAKDNSPFGLNHWSKTAECVVPLTPTIALFGNRCGITGYKEVDYNLLREVNRRTLIRSKDRVISAQPIPEYEAKTIVSMKPQSLLLSFVDLQDGRADEIIRQQKAQEEKEKQDEK